MGLVRLLGFLVFGGLVPTLSGCSVMGDHKDKHIPQYGIIDPHQPRELQMVSLPPHVVEPPDELEINVRPSGLDISQMTAIVQADGVIDLGFLGDVYVAGLTLAEVERKLEIYLQPLAKQKSIREPVHVSARVTNAGDTKRYYVLGTVTNQNSFPITGNETVLDGILQAGLKPNSLPEKAYLVRPHPAGGPDQILKIDWCGIKERGDTLTNYQLMPGDRIIIPGGKPPSLLRALAGG
jgi:polysaccharide export outer membrane protein